MISHFSYPFTDTISAKVSKGKHLFASPGLTCYHGPSRVSFLPFHLFLWIQQRLQLCRSVGSPEPVLQGALVIGTSPGLAGCWTGKESEPQTRAALSSANSFSFGWLTEASLAHACPGLLMLPERYGRRPGIQANLCSLDGLVWEPVSSFSEDTCALEHFFVYMSSLKWSTLFWLFLLLFHIQYTIALFIPSDKLLSQIFISGSVFRGTRKCHLCISLLTHCVLFCFVFKYIFLNSAPLPRK